MCGLSLGQSRVLRGSPLCRRPLELYFSRLAACCTWNHVFFLTAWPEFFLFTTDFIRSRVGGGEIILEEVTDSARQGKLLSLCVSQAAHLQILDFSHCLLAPSRGDIDENLKSDFEVEKATDSRSVFKILRRIQRQICWPPMLWIIEIIA